ncbi:MAG TPA: thymidine phosphorylase [Verrucomicrobia bacterium]|nr:MAG: thymidine phosphorylase [Lentisphaerae bacterium GWF2_57_35]HBA82601.1 thymidine phosphorylase [Verrucomicrobiota bacterium]
MIPQWIIEKKRDGLALSPDEIRFFIDGFTLGTIPDYQMSALAMAIFLKGMSAAETAVLTDAMLHSGDILDTSSIDKPKVDKHSTGGIGDKVSLILAPLVACCDIAVPMISGRGLGITGGTLDKLDSIPGYRTNLSTEEFLDVVRKCGCSIIGQTKQIAPADKKLYALRDVTGTVASIPLITASIMSKKLAEGIDALVLDVKWGKGAFMSTYERAVELAQSMIDVGANMGKKVDAVITDMNQPLGRTAGNSLEILESIQTLRGEGPADLIEITLALGADMLVLCGKAASLDEGKAILRKFLDNGQALERFARMIELQGGHPDVTAHPEKWLPTARIQRDYLSPSKGYLAGVDAESIGKACLVLGAGRAKTDDLIDFAVGTSRLAKIGDQVEIRQPLVALHANDEARLAEAEKWVAGAFTFSENRVDRPCLIK